jgi:hypothetical protein
VTDCYYRRQGTDGGFTVFESTDYTRSNWTPEIQHGSPPLALLTKFIEELTPPGLRLGRVTLDILGAIPVTEVRVRSWIDRPGSRICLVIAEMAAAGPAGAVRPVARVTGWSLVTTNTAAVATDRFPPLGAEDPAPWGLPWKDAGGYVDSVEWRPQAQESLGATVYWLSPLINLVDDEATTALQRLTMVVDSANGVGAALDPQRYVYMNTDTAVHLHRLPTGHDFALRARGSVGPDGIGVTTAELFDRDGFIGTSAQTLLIQSVEPRTR